MSTSSTSSKKWAELTNEERAERAGLTLEEYLPAADEVDREAVRGEQELENEPAARKERLHEQSVKYFYTVMRRTGDRHDEMVDDYLDGFNDAFNMVCDFLGEGYVPDVVAYFDAWMDEAWTAARADIKREKDAEKERLAQMEANTEKRREAHRMGGGA